MNDKEFTRDLFNLYVRQRKQLDESVSKDIKEKYIKKEQKYDEQKEKQKKRYYENKEKFGEKEYLEKLRVRNKTNEEKRKQKQKETQRDKQEPSSPIRRYAQSSIESNDFASDDDDDLESVFSEMSDIHTPIPTSHKNVFNNFIGF